MNRKYCAVCGIKRPKTGGYTLISHMNMGGMEWLCNLLCLHARILATINYSYGRYKQIGEKNARNKLGAAPPPPVMAHKDV